MNPITIGFIGFGEAAFHICSGLNEEGVKQIFAFDIMAQDSQMGPKILDRMAVANVEPVSSLQELIQKSQVLFCATSAKFALQIAEEVSQNLQKGHIYVDLNSASPQVKREIAGLIDGTGALFADAAVMEAVPPHRHRVPICVSGSGANAFEMTMKSYGMKISVVNEIAGSSSAMKMTRSIFMKGFTSLLLETLLAAHKSGIEKEILDSIGDTLRQKPIEELASLLLTRTAIHAERRVSEMSEVIHTLEELGIDDTMSMATKQKLQSLVDKGLREHFDFQAPDHYRDVLQAMDR